MNQRKRMPSYSGAQMDMFDRPDAPDSSPNADWELGYDQNEETALEAFERENPIIIRGQTDQTPPQTADGLTAIPMEQLPLTKKEQRDKNRFGGQYKQDNAGTVLAKIFTGLPLSVLGFDVDGALNARRERKYDEYNKIGERIGQAQTYGDEGALEDWRRKLRINNFADTQRGMALNATLAEALDNYDTQRAIDYAARQKQADDKINTTPIGEWLSSSGVKRNAGREYIEKLWQIQQAQNKQAADIGKTQADTAKVRAEADAIPIKLEQDAWEAMTKGVDYFDFGTLPQGAQIDKNNPNVMQYNGGQFLLRTTPDGNHTIWARDTGNDANQRARIEAAGRERAAREGSAGRDKNQYAVSTKALISERESVLRELEIVRKAESDLNKMKDADAIVYLGVSKNELKEAKEKKRRELEGRRDFLETERLQKIDDKLKQLGTDAEEYGWAHSTAATMPK